MMTFFPWLEVKRGKRGNGEAGAPGGVRYRFTGCQGTLGSILDIVHRLGGLREVMLVG
jgi:hypothetical protein